jgi:hypothetical protein
VGTKKRLGAGEEHERWRAGLSRARESGGRGGCGSGIAFLAKRPDGASGEEPQEYSLTIEGGIMRGTVKSADGRLLGTVEYQKDK